MNPLSVKEWFDNWCWHLDERPLDKQKALDELARIERPAVDKSEELRAWDAYAAAALSNPTCMLGRMVSEPDTGVGRTRSEWKAIDEKEARKVPERLPQIVAEIAVDVALFADAMLAERRKR